MYIVTKLIECPGCNFSNTGDFLAWHQSKQNNNFKEWLDAMNKDGKLIYTTSTVITPEQVENTYVFKDQESLDEYNAKLNSEPMSSSTQSLIDNGEVVILSSKTEVV